MVARLLLPAGVGAFAETAIGARRQTMRHRPQEFDQTGRTKQHNNPSLLAALRRIDFVADFRSRGLPSVKVPALSNLGLPPMQVEAATSHYCLPGTQNPAARISPLQSITGASGARIFGAVYPR